MTDAPRPTDHAIHRSSHLGYAPENNFGGVLSFLRRKYTRELDGVDVAVTGIPLDVATTFRPGARLGPQAIRAATVQLNEPLYPWGYGPCDRLSVVDYGDCPLDHHRPATLVPSITEHARRIIAGNTTLLSLGGDHFITYPLLKAHVERHGQPLALIHFDAHTDTWADDHPDSLNHGTMFYKAVKEGLIDPKRSVQIGIRTWNEDTLGIEVLGADWVHGQGTKAVAEKVLSIVGEHPAYLTFDIDCLDPAHAPGTGTPVVGGLSTAQALAIWRSLCPRLHILGADVVEVAPPFDVSGITALAAATLAHDLLCMWSL